MYTKLFQSIVTSSIWSEDSDTCKVWITLLALADKNGEVMATVPGLAHMARVSIKKAEDALSKFLAPDPYSRTKTDEGRRVEVIEGGWFVINHPLYRHLASREDQKLKAAERQKRFREREKRNAKPLRRNAKTLRSNARVTQTLHIAEAEADTESTCTSITNTDTKGLHTPLTPQGGKLPFSSGSFAAAWADWMQFRAELRKKLTPSTAKAQLKKLADMGERDAIASIRQSISNGWQGLFEPKDTPREFKVPTGGFHE